MGEHHCSGVTRLKGDLPLQVGTVLFSCSHLTEKPSHGVSAAILTITPWPTVMFFFLPLFGSSVQMMRCLNQASPQQLQHPVPQVPSPTHLHPPYPQQQSHHSMRACSPWGTMAVSQRTTNGPERNATAATWRSRSPRRCGMSALVCSLSRAHCLSNVPPAIPFLGEAHIPAAHCYLCCPHLGGVSFSLGFSLNRCNS